MVPRPSSSFSSLRLSSRNMIIRGKYVRRVSIANARSESEPLLQASSCFASLGLFSIAERIGCAQCAAIRYSASRIAFRLLAWFIRASSRDDARRWTWGRRSQRSWLLGLYGLLISMNPEAEVVPDVLHTLPVETVGVVLVLGIGI